MTEISVLNCSALLAEKKLKIAFAESATAGALSVAFALTPYSGTILLGSIVCYDAQQKINLLKISKRIIEEYTPESREVTYHMAQNSKKLFPSANVLVAVTGLTKSGGSETNEKPIGTMFIEFIIGEDHIHIEKKFNGNSHQIIQKTIKLISDTLINYLSHTSY